MTVVVGEALVDLVARDPGPAAMLHPCAGGSLFNLAVALGRQGVDVAFLGQLAEDGWGRYLGRRLHKAGVRVDYLGWSERHKTALSLAQLSEDGDVAYSFYLGEAADLHPPRYFARPPSEEVDAVCFGSYSIGVPSFRAVVEPYLWQMSRHAVVSFDPNIRDCVLPPSAEYRRDWLRWLDLCDVIKLSEEDLAWIWPGRAEAEVVAESLAQRVALFCVTRGERGVSLYHQSGAKADVPVFMGTKMVDTIGAGDTFHGALLAYLSRQGWLTQRGLARLDSACLERLARWALAAAALTCEQVGCQPPSAEAVDRRLQTVD